MRAQAITQRKARTSRRSIAPSLHPNYARLQSVPAGYGRGLIESPRAYRDYESRSRRSEHNRALHVFTNTSKMPFDSGEPAVVNGCRPYAVAVRANPCWHRWIHLSDSHALQACCAPGARSHLRPRNRCQDSQPHCRCAFRVDDESARQHDNRLIVSPRLFCETSGRPLGVRNQPSGRSQSFVSLGCRRRRHVHGSGHPGHRHRFHPHRQGPVDPA